MNQCQQQMALIRDTWAELTDILFTVLDNIGFTMKLVGHYDAQMRNTIRE